MVAVPGTAQHAGQVARYVGREWSEKLHGYPATGEPHEVDSESDEGRRLAKIARRDGAFHPFDQATADALGLKFEPITFSDGQWSVSVSKPTTNRKGVDS